VLQPVVADELAARAAGEEEGEEEQIAYFHGGCWVKNEGAYSTST
jgi:hypothetical protein